MSIDCATVIDSPDRVSRRTPVGLAAAVDGAGDLPRCAAARDDSTHASRVWFAWANGPFGALVLKIADEHPTIRNRL
ncbi:hypothetical protein [Sphingomonas sp.]|uniref:hypothetical protein n=1 Tax=Sphingomonas sp. TaxID=28214 RepID=UPI00333E5F66